MPNQMSLSERITYATVLIKCEYGSGVFGSGTGFLMNLCNDRQTNNCIPVMITNNHVIANATKISFEFCRSTLQGIPDDRKAFTVTYQNNAYMNWIHHPDANIDLVCLPLGPVLHKLQENKVEIYTTPLDTDLIPSEATSLGLSAMEEVVMVGYPIGLSDTFNHKPILRRGITATHYKNNYQGKEEFLVDMACFPGSSGSPIFLLNEGAFRTTNGLAVGSRVLLLGVLYEGPQYTAQGTLKFANIPTMPHSYTSIPTNLGVAIKASEILDFEPVLQKLEKGGTNG